MVAGQETRDAVGGSCVTAGGRSPGGWCVAGASVEGGGCRDVEGWWFTRRGKERTSRSSDCKVQSLHCAITITGGWQPARYWWCARQLSGFPTFQLLDLSASWFVSVATGGGDCVCVGTAKP